MSQAARLLVRSPALLAGMVALIVMAIGSRALQAQGATVLMFYGGTMKTPVLVTGADAAAFNNVIARSSITVSELADRPYISVALFWGSRTDPANNRTPLADLKPSMAWQHGRFYPAVPGKPALLLTTELTKRDQPVPMPSNGRAFVWGGPVPDEALAVLQRLGIVR